MEKYDIIFESENILYIKMSDLLINDYLKMYNDSKIQKLLFKKEFSENQILNWVNRQLLDENACRFSMIEKSTNEYIGNVEIIVKKDNIGEIVISIIPDKQNKHYGTETMREVIKYGYEKLGLNEIDLYVKKNNLKAIHCYEKVGFVLNGNSISDESIHMKHIK